METWTTSRRGKRQTISLDRYKVNGFKFFRIFMEYPRGFVDTVRIDGLSFTDNERKVRSAINNILKKGA